MEKEKFGFVLLFQFILVLVGLGYLIYDFIANNNLIFDIISLIVYICIILYTTILYKVPHGNSLRFLMLGFAISLIILAFGVKKNLLYQIPTALASLLIAYVSGRLDHLAKNKLVIVIIFALLFVSFLGYLSIFEDSNNLDPLIILSKLAGLASIIQFSSIIIAYIAFYDEHIKARNIAK